MVSEETVEVSAEAKNEMNLMNSEGCYFRMFSSIKTCTKSCVDSNHSNV